MCGIVGVMSDGVKQPAEFYEFMSNLLYEAEIRGRDATGFAAIADGEFVTDKLDVDAESFVRLSKAWRDLHGSRRISMIAHTRAATNGSPKDNKNNHPFHGPRYSMIHNGGIWGHYETAKQLGFSLETKCDSEVILHLLESEDNDRSGIIKVYNELDYKGWFAVSFLNRETGDINLFRERQTPCIVVKIARWNAIVFASTYDIINSAMDPILGGYAHARSFMKPVFDKEEMDDESHIRLCTKTNRAYSDDLRAEINYVIPKKKVQLSSSDINTFSGGESTWDDDDNDSSSSEGSRCIECFKNIESCRGAMYEVGADFMCSSCYDFPPSRPTSPSSRAEQMRRLDAEEDTEILETIMTILPKQLVSAYKDMQTILNRILAHREVLDDSELSDADAEAYLWQSGQDLDYKINTWSDMTLLKVLNMSHGEYLAYTETIEEALDISSQETSTSA